MQESELAAPEFGVHSPLAVGFDVASYPSVSTLHLASGLSLINASIMKSNDQRKLPSSTSTEQ